MSTYRFLRRVNTGTYSHDEFEAVESTEIAGENAHLVAVERVKAMMAGVYGENKSEAAAVDPAVGVFQCPTAPISAVTAAYGPATVQSTPPAATLDNGTPSPSLNGSIAPQIASPSNDITDEMMQKHGRDKVATLNGGRGIVEVNKVTATFTKFPLGIASIGVVDAEGNAVPPEQKNVVRQQWMDAVSAIQ